MMPRLDGYQTCALIKNNQMFKHTPVIMLSSKDGLFDKARGRIVGSEQYVTKPFTREELLDAIRKHLNHSSPGGRATSGKNPADRGLADRHGGTPPVAGTPRPRGPVCTHRRGRTRGLQARAAGHGADRRGDARHE